MRFEDPTEAGGQSPSTVLGSVALLNGSHQAPIQFSGWLQLLGLLEGFTSASEDNGEVPRPLPRNAATD